MKNESIHHDLAILGGPKAIPEPLRRYNPIGAEEAEAARNVIEGGVLSQFLGVWHEDFRGGPRVREFEKACESFFRVKHAVTTNSWTSGLTAAVGAIGIEPGDEVIVSPWTMSATAAAILHWNAIPVFADIERETFNLDPASVEANISPHTRAIMSVDIFGHPADMDGLMAVAARYGLKVISDTAQSPGAMYKGRHAGTISHVGGYSLNYHKHIHTGEGGILVTDDDLIADRARLIRNHAESVVGGMGFTDLTNMVGHNYRLGEIEAAIGIEQLKKLPYFVGTRQKAAERLTAGLKGLRGLRPPVVMPGCTHVYYVYPMVLDAESLGVPHERVAAALAAEGLEGISPHYINLHLLPMFQEKQAYGRNGFPWSSDICRRQVDYRRGICPVAEELQERSYLGYLLCMNDLGDGDVDLVIAAFRKVWAHMDALRSLE
jgi:dTDP-4-amino-4,6-dideoxygalactose transaminase